MELTGILLNKEKGAAELLRLAVDWLAEHPEALSIENADATLRTLRKTRPAMAAFAVLARRIGNAWRRNPEQEPEEIIRTIRGMIEEADEEVAARCARMLKEHFPARVVTLSNSSTVQSALEAGRFHVAEIHVLESNPGGEGKLLAENLRPLHKTVTLVPDDRIEEAVSASSLGLIGADTVFTDGAALNKVLSLDMARILKAQNKPLYILATSWKFSDHRSDTEITDPETVFELVPADLITEIISEK